ncbi:MAG: enoyl-CoA hydratase-related protein [Chloroflexota bacterium]
MNDSILLRETANGVARLTLNRPQKFNPLSEAMLDALQFALDDIGQDESVRVVVIQAEGKAFSAGHDLKEMRANPTKSFYDHLFAKCSKMMLSINQLPQRQDRNLPQADSLQQSRYLAHERSPVAAVD